MAAKSNSTETQTSVNQNSSSVVNPQNQKLEPEKELFAWKAPERPFKKRGRDFWVTVITIASLFGVILFFAEGAMPVILIIAMVFLFYVMSTVEPQEVDYRITNRGVKFADKTTEWQYLTRYWFSSRFDTPLLVFEMSLVPGRLELVINEKDKTKIGKALKDYVIEEEVPASKLDNAANWFAKKLPGN